MGSARKRKLRKARRQYVKHQKRIGEHILIDKLIGIFRSVYNNESAWSAFTALWHNGAYRARCCPICRQKATLHRTHTRQLTKLINKHVEKHRNIIDAVDQGLLPLSMYDMVTLRNALKREDQCPNHNVMCLLVRAGATRFGRVYVAPKHLRDVVATSMLKTSIKVWALRKMAQESRFTDALQAASDIGGAITFIQTQLGLPAGPSAV
jgi:hypothetical protein